MFYNVYHHFRIFNASVFLEPNTTGGRGSLYGLIEQGREPNQVRGGTSLSSTILPLRKRRTGRSCLKKRRSLTKSLSRLPGRKKREGKRGEKKDPRAIFFICRDKSAHVIVSIVFGNRNLEAILCFLLSLLNSVKAVSHPVLLSPSPTVRFVGTSDFSRRGCRV